MLWVLGAGTLLVGFRFVQDTADAVVGTDQMRESNVSTDLDRHIKFHCVDRKRCEKPLSLAVIVAAQSCSYWDSVNGSLPRSFAAPVCCRSASMRLRPRNSVCMPSEYSTGSGRFFLRYRSLHIQGIRKLCMLPTHVCVGHGGYIYRINRFQRKAKLLAFVRVSINKR